MKRARGNSLGARTAREEFCLVSHRRDKDVPGAFDLSMGRPCRPLSHIIVKYPTGGSFNNLWNF